MGVAEVVLAAPPVLMETRVPEGSRTKPVVVPAVFRLLRPTAALVEVVVSRVRRWVLSVPA